MSAKALHEAVRQLLLADNNFSDENSLAAIAGADAFSDPYFCVLHHPKQEIDSKLSKTRITFISNADSIYEFDKRSRTLLVNIYGKGYDKCELLQDRCVHLLAQPDKRFGAYPSNIQSLKLNVGTVSFSGSSNFYADMYEMWRISGVYNVSYVQK
jgi:hypothetical protein